MSETSLEDTIIEAPTHIQKILDATFVDNTADIVAAYCGRNEIAISQLPDLIDTVYASLQKLGGRTDTTKTTTTIPAVPIAESVFPDYIICLEDGKKLKMLKRHLQTSYNMTPEQYRAKWGLGPNYPMTAPDYARIRSGLAKKIGLGTSRKTPAPKAAAKKAPAKKAAPRKKAAAK